jgi:hypothetical protein
MQDAFEFEPGIAIAKYQLAHPSAIQSSVSGDETFGKSLPNRGNRPSSRLSKLMRNRIRIHDTCAPRRKKRRGGRLTAANAARQANY